LGFPFLLDFHANGAAVKNTATAVSMIAIPIRTMTAGLQGLPIIEENSIWLIAICQEVYDNPQKNIRIATYTNNRTLKPTFPSGISLTLLSHKTGYIKEIFIFPFNEAQEKV